MLGITVGPVVGVAVGRGDNVELRTLGAAVGPVVGIAVGGDDNDELGDAVGEIVGTVLGDCVGVAAGNATLQFAQHAPALPLTSVALQNVKPVTPPHCCNSIVASLHCPILSLRPPTALQYGTQFG